MELTVEPRQKQKKRDALRLRREGKIPAIIYSKGKENEMVTVDAQAFRECMRHVEQGHLPTVQFTLITGKAKRKAIVKAIDYNITNYNVSHLDFELLEGANPVKVKVPIDMTGVGDCAGVKLGGFLRRVVSHMRIRCLPKDIPNNFAMNVADLKMNQSLRLKDIALPTGVTPLANLEEVAIVVAKR